MSTEPETTPADANPGQVPEPAQTPAVTPPPTNVPAPETGAEAFDEARALATIRQLREREKALDRANRDREREAAELRSRVEAFETEKLSAEEKTAKRLADAERDAQASKDALRDARLRYEVATRAAAKGIVDPDAAVRLLDLSTVTFDAAGTPQGVDAALEALAAAKPYLVKPAAPAAPPPVPAASPANPATGRTQAGQPIFTTTQISDYRFWTQNRDAILAAQRDGRIRKE